MVELGAPQDMIAAEARNADPVQRRESRQPILVADRESLWSWCDREGERLFAELRRVAARANADLLISKSPPGVYPVSLGLLAWVPAGRDGSLTHRLSVDLFLTPRPHRRSPLSVELRLADGKRVHRMLRHPERDEHALAVTELESLVTFALGRAPVPDFVDRWAFGRLFPSKGDDRFISAAEALHRPTKWAAKVAAAVIILGLSFLLLVSFADVVLPVIGQFIVPLLVLGGSAYFIARTRGARRSRIYYLDAAKPATPPRDLIALDSWHAVLRGAGEHHQAVRSRIERMLEALPLCTAHWERIRHVGLDLVEERDQLVAGYRRALVFLHVEQYGPDLYVAWDGHINRAIWKEEVVHRDAITRKHLLFMTTVAPGHQPITHYDIADFNTLSELIHGKLTNELRQLRQELKIDQELDFVIIRGARNTDRPPTKEAEPKKRLQRTA